MRIKLEPKWSRQLLSLPESGMGYQRVDLQMADGREVNDVPAFNGEEVEVPAEYATSRISAVTLHRE